MYILGISAYYHDSAAVILKDDEIIAAAQEERFTRIKHDPNFPSKSVEYCLKEAKIDIEDIAKVVYYEDPKLKFNRIIDNHVQNIFKGFYLFINTFPDYLLKRHFVKRDIVRNLGPSIKQKIIYSNHHLSHLSSAYYPSPFDEAVIITMDGVGELDTATIAHGKGQKINIQKRMIFPDSIGLLYSAFTVYCGFKVNSGEYKLMGLAPYGTPKYCDLIENKLVKIFADGSIKLNMSYFTYCTDSSMFGDDLAKLIGFPPRTAEAPITQEYADLASSIQKTTEKIVVNIAKYARSMIDSENLCLAGGVALNCVANGKLMQQSGFKNIWIQPAAGDAGTALGAALHYTYLSHPRLAKNDDSMQGSYLGPEYLDDAIEVSLKQSGVIYQKLTEQTLIDETAKLLSQEKVVGWFQGRMEFGPRALGNRSILGDARSTALQRQMNLKIKLRESFRPFAPSILEEDVEDYFEFEKTSPYMLFVAKVKKSLCLDCEELPNIESDIHNIRSSIPAITHVDFTARLQTVSKNTNSKYHQLISAFKRLTGSPILINTSFNIRGEPIVCSPEDAIRCFSLTHMDVLAIGNFLVLKEQNPSNKEEIDAYIQSFEKD